MYLLIFLVQKNHIKVTRNNKSKIGMNFLMIVMIIKHKNNLKKVAILIIVKINKKLGKLILSQ